MNKRAQPLRSLLATIAGLLMLLGPAPPVSAHEIRPAYLQLDQTAPSRYRLLWRTPVLSGMRLPVVLRLPPGIRDVAPPEVEELSDSLIERRVLEVGPAGLVGQRFEFVGLEATITQVLVRVQMLDGAHSTILVRSSQPWVDLSVSQGTLAVVGTYLSHGIEHILLGADHLLFVFGLLLLVNNRWMLIKTITAFTLAHSITLALATFGYTQIPLAPLNAAIALSILFLGVEIVRSWRGESSLTIRRPWVVAFAFGLLHGFGFATALTSAGLPRHELPVALVSFNVGVELGQLGFIALMLALERSFRILEVRWPRWATALPAYSVGSMGAFWTLQRVALLLQGAG